MLDIQRDARGIVTCWIDNPGRRNALNDGMLAALADVMEDAGAQGARTVIVRGRHNIFCSGRDLGELDAGEGEDEAALARRIAPALRLARAVRHCAVPTVAVIDGKAVGLGVALATWCDMALASDGATFSIPEARAGIAPSFTAVSLMQTVGRRAALSLCLTGRSVGAADALALGLVQQVCAAQELEAAVETLAGSFIKGSPQALRHTKALLDQAASQSFGAAIDLASRMAVASMRADEAAEGMAAFRAKRPPAWAVAGQDGNA
jgi:methylglutaconyl-CoA hydratase